MLKGRHIFKSFDEAKAYVLARRDVADVEGMPCGKLLLRGAPRYCAHTFSFSNATLRSSYVRFGRKPGF